VIQHDAFIRVTTVELMCNALQMAPKSSGKPRIKRSHAHVFDFKPWEYLSAPDWESLSVLLHPQRGCGAFLGLHAYRLRLTKEAAAAQRSPWAVEVPLGAFSSFSEALCTPEGDTTGRTLLYDRILKHRSPSEGPKRPGPVGLGFSPTRDVFERDGVTYYRENVITELGYYSDMPQIFWALSHLLRKAAGDPQVITGRPYVGGRLQRVRKEIPLSQRVAEGKEHQRGPNWTEEEDAVIHRVLKGDGRVISGAHFDAQEAQFRLDGRVPRDRDATLVRDGEIIVADLHHKRTLASIRSRVHYLNRKTRRKYMVNGRVPLSSKKDYLAAYLGAEGRGLAMRKTTKDSWLLICQLDDGGSVFIDHAKAPLLRTATVAKANPLPFHVAAFVRMSEKAVDALLLTLRDHHQQYDWFHPVPAVLDVLKVQQLQMLDALAAGDDHYLRMAKSLRLWLSQDLLKHTQDDTSSLWRAPLRCSEASREPSPTPTALASSAGPA
jgi:hypothetical protein